MNLKSKRHRDGSSPSNNHKTHSLRFAFSNIHPAWTGAGVSGLALAGLAVLGRIPLMLAAGASLAMAGLFVLATMSNRPKLVFMFFLNACFLIVPQRELDGTDLIVLLSLLTALLTAFGLAASQRADTATVTTTPTIRNFGMQSVLIGFAIMSIISTLSNSQSVLILLPWLNGVFLGLLICSAPSSQLPSFSTARRAILAGGGLAAIYDLYLLGSGRAVNLGPFNAGRFTGSLGDYELLAEFYGAMILLGLTAIFFDNCRRWRLAAAVLLLPSFIILLATQSRGPIVILCVVGPILALVSAVQFRKSTGKIFAVTSVLAAIIYFSIGTLSTLPLFERLSSIQFEGSIESTLNRAGVWGYFTQLPGFVDAGLIGNGFYYPYEEIGTYPHSIYLWLLWSGGIVGLVFFALFVLLLLFKLLVGISLRHPASLSAAAVVLYLLLDEVKIEAARTSASVCFLWVALSLALLASREQREL